MKHEFEIKDYYYRNGDVVTTRHPSRPSMSKLMEWWHDFKHTKGVEKYDFYLCGKSLVDMNSTWDLDINFTGRIGDINEAGYILRRGWDLALNKYNIAVDLSWYSSVDFLFDKLVKENQKVYFCGSIPGREVVMVNNEITKDITKPEPHILKSIERPGKVRYPILFFPQIQPSDKYVNIIKERPKPILLNGE